MQDKLKLLDLSKNFIVTRHNADPKFPKDKSYYKVEETDGDIYVIMFDDGSIEYWGYTGEYYDFKFDIEHVKRMETYINLLKEKGK